MTLSKKTFEARTINQILKEDHKIIISEVGMDTTKTYVKSEQIFDLYQEIIETREKIIRNIAFDRYFTPKQVAKIHQHLELLKIEGEK